MESFYHVADDVIQIVEVINRWLRSLADDRGEAPAFLLNWMRHVEGGMTTQRIQDALLLIRSYCKLLDSYSVGKIILLSGAFALWEDDVLVRTAQVKEISVQRIKASRHCFIKAVLSVGLRSIKNRLRIPYRLGRMALTVIGLRKCLAREVALESMPTEERAQVPSRNGHIIFQLCSSADKHIEGMVPLMKALRGKGFEIVALTCFVPEAAAKVREKGLEVKELAEFVSFSCIGAAVYRVFKALRKATKNKRTFIHDRELYYQGVPLGNLLWPSVDYFFSFDLLTRELLKKGLEEYFRRNVPRAMRLWGGVNLPHGYIAWKILEQGRKPLLFDYWSGPGIDWPYSPREDPTDLFLAAGRVEEEMVVREGLPAERVVKVGSLRYNHLEHWKEKYSLEASRAYLDIPSGYSLHIFYGPNVLLRGQFTDQEQSRVTEALLSFVSEHPSFALTIKPHPSGDPGKLERMIETHSSGNVFHVDHELPYHALNAADVVIVKFSTLAIEAMLLRKPVISVCLDGEKRWKSQLRDAPEYVTATADLVTLLRRIGHDHEFRDRWTEFRLAQQERFLRDYFSRSSDSSVEYAASVIVRRLSGWDGR